MAGTKDVVTAFIGLRDSLTRLAANTALDREKSLLLHHATAAGTLAQNCAAQFGASDLPAGDEAISKAVTASKAAEDADPTDHDAIDRVIAASDAACAALKRTMETISTIAKRTAQQMRTGLIGSLRVSASPSPASPNARLTDRASGKPAAQPAYVVNVAKLFPVEAATLFPIGQALAGDSGIRLTLLILMVLAFIVALRWLGTMVDGKPAAKEIIVAVFSFLLWVGSLKGYWVADGLVHVSWISPEASAGFFGIATTMWVSLVPLFFQPQAGAGKP